jgi:hypothetical protein
LKVNGPLNFDFNVAVIAQKKKSENFAKQLGAVPLSPLTIPGVVTVEPELTFGVGLDLGFKTVGAILAGVTVEWSEIEVVVDLLKKSASRSSGLKPKSITKSLLLQGETALSGEVFATLGMGFSVK